jgi:hypothetical protein
MKDRTFETGMYFDRATAEDTVTRLHALGYTSDEISVMMNDGTRARDFAEDTGSSVALGATTGAVIGGGLGAIAAGLAATGSIVAIAATTGMATPLVAGPLAAALAGLGAGGAAGGIIGALVGAGIPKEKAERYGDDLDNGGILLGVHPRDEHRERVREILEDREPAGSRT